jgi:hypothetical protein
MIKVQDFISNIWDGEYTPLDIDNILRLITNGYKEQAISSILQDVFSLEEGKLKEYANENLNINYSDEFKGFNLMIWLHGDEAGLAEKRKELYFDAFPEQYMRMHNFRLMLYKHIDIKPLSKQTTSVSPIHWLNGEKSLRLFIEEIKSAGLIVNRDTDKIIQEHFKKFDKTPQPIKWIKSNRLLIYLFSKLSEAGIIDTMDRQYKLITEHFLDKKGQHLKTDSLKSDYYNMKNFHTSDPKGSKTVDCIIEKLNS